MPMQWTTDNDRILLLKLIETHGISIDASKIANAWPAGGPKPTPRAITERFVKLRQLAGVAPAKKGGSGSRPTMSIGGRTPSSSAKKRKVNKKVDDGESDGEDHLTPPEQETPTPTPKARKTASGRAKVATPKAGSILNSNFNDSTGSPTAVRVKEEPVQSPFSSTQFSNQFDRARNLRASMHGTSFDSEFGFANLGMPTPGASGPGSSFEESPGGIDGDPDMMVFSSFAGGNDMASGIDMGSESMGTYNQLVDDYSLPDGFDISPSHAFDNHIAAPSTPKKPVQTPKKTSTNMFRSAQMPSLAMPVRDSVTPSESSPIGGGASQERRQRAVRQASKQATESISFRLQAQKEEDRQYGEKSSEEDSAASEFQDDDEYV